MWLLLLLPLTVVPRPPEPILQTTQPNQGNPVEVLNQNSFQGGKTGKDLFNSSNKDSELVKTAGFGMGGVDKDGLDEVFAAVKEEDWTRFEFCSECGSTKTLGSKLSALVMLTEEFSRVQRAPHVSRLLEEAWSNKEDEENLIFTFGLPQALELNECDPTVDSVMLLFFVVPSKTDNLCLTFSSGFLDPVRQTACISWKTQFIVLTVRTFQRDELTKQQVSISPEPSSTDKGTKVDLFNVQNILLRRSERDSKSKHPLLLVTYKGGSHQDQPSGFRASDHRMFLFLCELQRFLSEVLPPTQLLPHPTGGTSTVSLDTLDTLPPLSLGVASSENFLLGLLNSSAPTLFSFPHERSGLRSHRGELSLRPPLLSLLRLKLEEAIRGNKLGQDMIKKVQRLKDLCALSREGDQTEATDESSSSESQYLALLLLKALQTVQGVWEALPAQRTARGGQEEPAKAKCHLHSLTVSLEKYLLEPSTATINNCQGVCSFPLPNSNNHAILLNSLEQSTVPPSRLPCCVPVQYADLLVIELHSDGPTISVKTNMVAKECGCR
ncbi:uncharacterized protein LOC114769385 [Denticeps clupeoides]|uniref:TGF-beta family profile domain-containing protein n=1 Tax=Denticeps clupeoides TaxID=299321 RepID=A0AAY4D330_9TELE|nr:uncharacterized protein LOC114769385 [Denticeps clupeoides]